MCEALEQGINLFDTADVYGQGDSERMLGRLFSSRRNDIVLCTKAGRCVSAKQGLIRLAKPFLGPVLRRWKRGRQGVAGARQLAHAVDFTPSRLRTQLESSLKSLRTDHVDLFLLHGPGETIIKQDEIPVLLEELRSAGLARHCGISCDTVEEARVALQQDVVDCLQLPLSPYDSDMVLEILPLAAERGIYVMAREVFAGGRVLTNEVFGRIAATEPARSAAQVALQLPLQREDVGVVLAGMSCRRHLLENLKALTLPPLSEECCRQLWTSVGEGGSNG